MPAGATYEPIATTTVSGSSTGTITFNSFSGYTDIRVVLTGRSTGAASSTDAVFMRFNSDSSSLYSTTGLYGNGSSASSSRNTGATQTTVGEIPQDGTASGLVSTIFVDVFSYAGSTNKTALSINARDLNGSGSVERVVHLYRSTSAITSISFLQLGGNNFKAGTTATLYGIKNSA